MRPAAGRVVTQPPNTMSRALWFMNLKPPLDKETDRGCETGDAVGGSDRELELGAGQDSNRGGHLSREATSRKHGGTLVTKGLHDVVTIGHQSNVNSNTSKDQNPDRDKSLLRVDTGMHSNVVDSGKGTDRIGHIIGSVSRGGKASSDNLDCREEVLGLGVKFGGMLVGSKDDFVLSLVDVMAESAKELGLHALAKDLSSSFSRTREGSAWPSMTLGLWAPSFSAISSWWRAGLTRRETIGM